MRGYEDVTGPHARARAFRTDLVRYLNSRGIKAVDLAARGIDLAGRFAVATSVRSHGGSAGFRADKLADDLERVGQAQSNAATMAIIRAPFSTQPSEQWCVVPLALFADLLLAAADASDDA